MSVSFYQSRNQFLKICLILNSVILPAALCGEPHWSVEVQADARIGADARTTEVWSLTDDIIAICEPQRVRTFQRSSGEIINDFTIQEDYRLISHFAGSPILRGKISAYDSDAKKWKEVKRVAGYHFTDLLTGNTFDYLAPEGWQIDLDPWKFVPGPQSPYFYIALSRHRKPSKEEQENGLQMVAHSKALILNLGTGNTAREIKSNSYSISPDRHLKQHWTPIIYPLQGDLAYSEGLVCGGGPDWSCESESDWFSGLVIIESGEKAASFPGSEELYEVTVMPRDGLLDQTLNERKSVYTPSGNMIMLPFEGPMVLVKGPLNPGSKSIKVNLPGSPDYLMEGQGFLAILMADDSVWTIDTISGKLTRFLPSGSDSVLGRALLSGEQKRSYIVDQRTTEGGGIDYKIHGIPPSPHFPQIIQHEQALNGQNYDFCLGFCAGLRIDSRLPVAVFSDPGSRFSKKQQKLLVFFDSWDALFERLKEK